MRSVKFSLLLLGGFALSGLAWSAPQHEHTTPAEHAAHAPIPAQRWTPDAPLREGMGRVHTALEELRHYEMGHMSEAMALDRVATIEAATTYMFAHCKLAPDADAALHGMLVPLVASTQTLKRNPKDMAAVAAMRAAVADYPRYFNDPGWDTPAPVMHEMHDEP
ncbi:DnrO protein [Rhodanobacter umsongensis]|uniref:DnrO protein n=1 Tax=Rhodanobacter umsongensis TaxID=633153 RepID=A0ABW0JMY5_9GAMM